MKYKCGCYASGDNVASYCPVHGDALDVRLKTGHRVICILPDTVETRAKYNEAGIIFESRKYTIPVLAIETVVSGDTEEKGLSVVSRDNPDCCFILVTPSAERLYPDKAHEAREFASKGLCDAWVTNRPSTSHIECPYGKKK
jgi:hypothetical protein